MSWLTRLKTWATEQPTQKPTQGVIPSFYDATGGMVQAPVLGFVHTVNDNPRRFRCRRVRLSEIPGKGPTYHWMSDEQTPMYRLTDRQEGIEFYVMYSNGRIYTVYGIDFSLNHWENKYLHEKLSPIFMRAYNRQQRLHLYKGDKVRALEAIEAKRKREKWTAIYGE